MSLFKIQFVKKLLHRKKMDETYRQPYMRNPSVNDKAVENFYIAEAIDLPAKRMSVKASFNDRLQKKVLTKKVADLHKEFISRHPNYKISLTTFSRRRPKHVLLSSSRAFQQCLCETCVNPMLKIEKLNRRLVSLRPKNVDELVRATLCKTEYSRKCIDRKCTECGVEKVVNKWKEELCEAVEDEIHWFRWEKTAQSGKDQVVKHGTLGKMIEELKIEMQGLARHLKTARWQRKEYQSLIASLPNEAAVLTLDFAENYLCKFQNEVQSAHWSYRQVTVHPCVLHYRCQKPGCSELVTQYIVYLSDDMRHDAAFTKVVMDWVIEHLSEKKMKSIYIFSDGCSSQYKSRLPFAHLTELAEKYSALKIERHFFGAHHGKSLCDSCGVVKNVATRAVQSGNAVIQNAGDMLKFCTENLQVVGDESAACKHMLRSFEKIQGRDVSRATTSDSFLTLPGTRNLHALRPVALNRMQKKLRSCFCQFCTAGLEGCKNSEFTGTWEFCTLKEKAQRKTPLRKKCKKSHPSLDLPDCDIIQVEGSYQRPESSNRSRRQFFQEAQLSIERASTFEELRSVCTILEPQMSTWKMFEMSPVHDIAVDATAVSLLPACYVEQFVPITVEGDGNCFCRSLSFLMSGTEANHTEIRVRMVINLVINEDDYVDPEKLKQSCGLDSCLPLLTLFAAIPFDGSVLSDPEKLKEFYQSETMAVRRRGAYCGAWQMFAAANITNSNILSVYPHLGEEPIFTLMNRKFRPSSGTAEKTEAIMWSSSRQDMVESFWVANHIVPLLPLAQEKQQCCHSSR
ncbi:uncharacterized protein LOC143279993 [Babylonia areolata]|uniref:uncharacterized protein LOC143279993 n=1 Tax=Babylonia areolata TaxID=304850 RepID=UPI003FD5A6F8